MLLCTVCTQKKKYAILRKEKKRQNSACCQIAKEMKSPLVIGCVGSKQKIEIAKQFGADVVINYTDNPNWGATVKKLSKNRGIGKS